MNGGKPAAEPVKDIVIETTAVPSGALRLVEPPDRGPPTDVGGARGPFGESPVGGRMLTRFFGGLPFVLLFVALGARERHLAVFLMLSLAPLILKLGPGRGPEYALAFFDALLGVLLGVVFWQHFEAVACAAGFVCLFSSRGDTIYLLGLRGMLKLVLVLAITLGYIALHYRDIHRFSQIFHNGPERGIYLAERVISRLRAGTLAAYLVAAGEVATKYFRDLTAEERRRKKA